MKKYDKRYARIMEEHTRKLKKSYNDRIYYLKNIEKIRAYRRRYYLKNKEKENETMRKWRLRNKKKKKFGALRYRKENQEKIRASEKKRQSKPSFKEWKRIYTKNRRKNPKIRMDNMMGTSIRRALKGMKKGRRWEKLVGYTVYDLLNHLEKLFDIEMSWSNYGTYWVIDHIKPKSLFEYNSSEDLEFKKCWSLNNLQPLEKIANLKKWNHYH